MPTQREANAIKEVLKSPTFLGSASLLDVTMWRPSGRGMSTLMLKPTADDVPLEEAPVTFSEWNEETFVYGHFAMVVPTRHAIFPNVWEYLEVRKDKHHF